MLNEFGFELEFGSPLSTMGLTDALHAQGVPVLRPWSYTDHEWVNYARLGLYSVGQDASVATSIPCGYNIEVRSFVTTIPQLDLYKPFFTALKTIGGFRTNNRCGLHIHVSNQDCNLDAELMMKMSKNESVRVKPKRRMYSDWKLWKDEHYAAVNQRKPNHVEVRWFNAAIDFRYLCKMIRLVDGYATRAASVAQK